MDLFDRMTREADRGKTIIESYLAESAAGQSSSKIVLLFPDSETITLQTAYKHINLVLRNYDAVIIIASVNIDDIHSYTKRKMNVSYVNDDDMRCLLRYASMMAAQTSIVSITSIRIISLTMPYNRKAKSLVGVKDVSLDMIVCRSLYGIFGSMNAEVSKGYD